MIAEILEAGTEKAGSDYDEVQSRMKKGFDSPEAVADLIGFLASAGSDWLTGREISAVWDPWREWKDSAPVVIDRDMYTLRRIDGRRYMMSKE